MFLVHMLGLGDVFALPRMVHLSTDEACQISEHLYFESRPQLTLEVIVQVLAARYKSRVIDYDDETKKWLFMSEK